MALVQAMVEPIEQACAAELKRLTEYEARRLELGQGIGELQRRTADVE